VTNLCQGPYYASDEQHDTGFNTKNFARPSREDRGCPVAYSQIERRLPRVVVRCIAQHKGRVLLCQRADEPRRAFWNTPGGFVESGETLRTAAVRETLEESGVLVDALQLRFIYEFPQLNEIVVMFGTELRNPSFAPGKESLDARLFDTQSMPWRQLAFPTDSDALRRTLTRSAYRPRDAQIVECFWEADGRIFTRQR
jgi:ADP-ribose pyrophosphatase YjhB (NUDIX family)